MSFMVSFVGTNFIAQSFLMTKNDPNVLTGITVEIYHHVTITNRVPDTTIVPVPSWGPAHWVGCDSAHFLFPVYARELYEQVPSNSFLWWQCVTGRALFDIRDSVKMFYVCIYVSHLCRPVRSTFVVRETASLGIMGEPRVPPLNPSESIVLSEHYRLWGV